MSHTLGDPDALDAPEGLGQNLAQLHGEHQRAELRVRLLGQHAGVAEGRHAEKTLESKEGERGTFASRSKSVVRTQHPPIAVSRGVSLVITRPCYVSID